MRWFTQLCSRSGVLIDYFVFDCVKYIYIAPWLFLSCFNRMKLRAQPQRTASDALVSEHNIEINDSSCVKAIRSDGHIARVSQLGCAKKTVSSSKTKNQPEKWPLMDFAKLGIKWRTWENAIGSDQTSSIRTHQGSTEGNIGRISNIITKLKKMFGHHAHSECFELSSHFAILFHYLSYIK